jgi:hypothetical protein
MSFGCCFLGSRLGRYFYIFVIRDRIKPVYYKGDLKLEYFFCIILQHISA